MAINEVPSSPTPEEASPLQSEALKLVNDQPDFAGGDESRIVDYSPLRVATFGAGSTAIVQECMVALGVCAPVEADAAEVGKSWNQTHEAIQKAHEEYEKDVLKDGTLAVPDQDALIEIADKTEDYRDAPVIKLIERLKGDLRARKDIEASNRFAKNFTEASYLARLMIFNQRNPE